MGEFITTLEMMKHCETAFHLKIRETMEHVIHMNITTKYVTPPEFFQNVKDAVAYLEPFAEEKGYKKVASIPEWLGSGSTATVKFEKM